MEKIIQDVLLKEKISDKDYYVAILDGADCRSMRSFLKQIGNVFNFPPYYGQNINALNECLNDLEWLNKLNYILIVTASGKLLCDEPKETRDHMLAMLEDVSKEWDSVPNYDGEDVYRKRADFRIRLL